MSRRQDIRASRAERPVIGGPRLAFYIHSMEGGGAERVWALVASGLAARGYPVDLVLNRAEGPHLAFVTGDVRVVSLECRTPSAAARLTRYLGERNPACLISALQNNNLNAMLAARATGTPLAVTVHGIMSVHRYNLRTSGLFGSVAQVLSPLIYRAAAAVGVVSEAVRRDIAYSAERPHKFHVLHNPVDTDHFSPRVRANDLALTQLPNDDDSPIVLGVGRFDRVKNFALLIEAFAQMRRPARLVLLGDGPERQRLKALARERGIAGRVFMPGFVEDPAPWYRRAGVHAVASRCEGFGNTIVEALATGTPVVIAECQGAPIDLLGQGRYGTIVPANDPASMAAALAEVIDRPPNPAPLIARAAEFSLGVCLDRYEAMIGALTKQDGPRTN
ncbi:glycosyltransferase [Methyloceanibacter sp.]|uniref:glycosyltransferase n=1 Tax=Methyloceanibacter sp. TaxID=1965321 RepID=UPI002D284C52|nr:glycosyltransferase [Methyloceanibacter sp.]HZP08105.1 glycosyltransferase [Methyloceanibacter sp.]